MKNIGGNHGGCVRQLLHFTILHYQENTARINSDYMGNLLSLHWNHDMQVNNAG